MTVYCENCAAPTRSAPTPDVYGNHAVLCRPCRRDLAEHDSRPEESTMISVSRSEED